MRIGEARRPGPAAAPKVRGSKPKFNDIVLLNSSGRPQLVQALQYYKNKNDGVAAQLILNQEHHARGQAWNDLQLKARQLHWHLQGAQASSAAGHASAAGVSVATRAHVSMGLPPGWQHDTSTCESPGRLAAAWIDGIVKGGLVVMSVYLWHTEGMTRRNRSILDRAGQQIKMFKGPWLIAGDLNMTPEHFEADAGDWLRKV